MAKLSSLAVNLDMTNDGTWGKFAGIEFRIRRMSADVPQALRSSLVMENIDAIQADPDSEATKKLQDSIDLRVLTESILLDWKGLEDDDGAEIPFSVEKAAEILGNKEYGDLRTFIQNYSFNRENYQVKAEKAVAESVKTTADS